MAEKKTPTDAAGGNGDGASPADQAAANDAEEKKIEDQLVDLSAELEEAKDRALRSRAELENYRKRMARQMDDERRFANVALVRDLLPVVDNVRRAIEAAQTAADAGTLLEGFQMVGKQLADVLERHQCKEIPALHEKFDPNLHEAIMQQPSRDFPAGTVLQVVRPGFQMHDRVVRPSQVIVSSVPPAAEGDGRAEE